jgi:hypothetical protein
MFLELLVQLQARRIDELETALHRCVPQLIVNMPP